MPIPTYDACMLPVLRHCAEKVWLMRDLVVCISDDLALTPEERAAEIPSGGATVIASRVGWAKTFLKQAGLVEQPKRGHVQITRRGRDALAANPAKIGVPLLMQYPEFRSFMDRTRAARGNDAATHPVANVAAANVSVASAPTSTPEEQIAAASRAHEEAVRDGLLARILEATPAFFEKLIVDLLLAMGYGGSRADAGEQLGKSGDGGVDGVIREDQLGLDRVYLQAKRYQPGNSVGSEAVQAFIGALIGKGSNKGVLITTSTFTKAAATVANQSGSLRIVLIDGEELTRLLLRFNVGVRVMSTVAIKRVDPTYFEPNDTD